jgi:cyclase
MRSLLTAIALAFALGPLAGAGAQQPPASTPLNVIPAQGQVHLISGAGVNVTVHVGKYGVLLVDTPQPSAVPRVMEEIRKLSTLPLRWVINTSSSRAHVAGNAALVAPAAGRGAGGAPFGFVGLARPSIVAHQNVLNRLSNPPQGSAPTPPDGLPTTTYFQPTSDFSNGEAIVLYHQPAAHSDGDSVVLFRGSDVISTGAIFTPGRYPVIDIALGGSVQGLISALTSVLMLAVPEGFASGGTLIIPAYGRICEESDVAEFRDMVVIIRDRVQDSITKGMTWEQIKASRPSRDYDAEYGASAADVERFVESIYRSLSQPRRGARS